MKEQQNPISIEDAYFKGLSESPNDNLYVDGIRELSLLSKEERLSTFKNLLDKTDLYKIDKRKSSNRVKKAWEVIDNFFLSKAPELLREKITPLVYGSIIFDDPRNLDYDLLLLSNSQRDINKTVDNWDLELSNKWEEVSNGGGHFSYLALDTLQMNCNIVNSNMVEYAQKYAEMIDFDFINVSITFTGVLVNQNDKRFIEINKQLPKVQERALNIANQSPILMSTMIRNMQQMIIIRETRRNGFNNNLKSSLHSSNQKTS